MFDVLEFLLEHEKREMLREIQDLCTKSELNRFNSAILNGHNRCPTCFAEIEEYQVTERRGDNALFDEILTFEKCPNGHNLY